MNPLDPNKTKAVWDRVMANQGELPVAAPAAPASNQTVCASEIMELIQDERNDACTYFALAKCVGGRDCACLQRIAQEELCHAKRLSTVYYVLTGNRACVCPEPTESVTCLPESLRKQHQQELEGVETYEALARRESPYQNPFWQLSDEERRHAQKVLCLLQRYL